MKSVHLTDISHGAIHMDESRIRGGVAVKHMDPVLGVDIHSKTVQSPK